MKPLNEIVEPLINWFQENKRDLPWRHTSDSYKIWISEIMLQQTRVEAVKEYYARFLKELPTINDLASVSEDKLLKLWEGLGYYSRARNLKKCAESIVAQNLKELPRDYEKLLKLPGIGPYSAASIGSIAYGLKTPAIDGNVLRVMTRLQEDDRDIGNVKLRQEYFQKLQKIMPINTRDFTESLMELGALICLPNGMPNCQMCPIKEYCQAYQHQTMLNFPIKTKVKARKIENKTILILKYHDEIALHKRDTKGLLASLYEFMTINYHIEEDEMKTFLNSQKIIFQDYYVLPNAKHIFSHIEWIMKGYLVECEEKPDGDFIWVKKQDALNNYSIPNAFSKYTNYLKE